ncbi:MAG TPA: PKD domain-containing protein [Solirubrobacteraceae bacterium]
MGLLGLVAGAGPAGAVVAKIGGHAYGVTPVGHAGPPSAASSHRAAKQTGPGATLGPLPYDVGPGGGGPLIKHSGPVMHSVATHIIYWDPNNEFTLTTKAIVNGFFAGVAHDSGLASNVFAIGGQYTDTTGNAAYSSTASEPQTDTQAYPTSGNCVVPEGGNADHGPYSACLRDSQLRSELAKYVSNHKLLTGITQQYFLLLPHKVDVCFDQTLKEELEGFEPECSNNEFCAYHGFVQGAQPGEEIIYSAIPFSLLDDKNEHVKACQADGNPKVQAPSGDTEGGEASTRYADVALKYISHEYMEATTDPLLNNYFDARGLEIGDKCNAVPFVEEEEGFPGIDTNAFSPTLGGSPEAGTLFNQSIDGGHYYLQSEWDNADRACLMRPVPLSAAFGPPSGTAGSPIGFTGSVTDPYGQPVVTWSFGDGAIAAGTSPSHVYAAPGNYTVTMTARDALTASTTAPVEHTVVVSSPPTPPPPAVTATTSVLPPPAPNSSFALKAKINAKTGVITFTASVLDPGMFSWMLTFQNGKFGVFASSTSKCKRGFVRLNGKCRPAKIVFGKGSKLVAAPGTLSFTVRPSASALKALKTALRQKKGLPVAALVTFQSAHGGSPVAHTPPLTDKLKK